MGMQTRTVGTSSDIHQRPRGSPLFLYTFDSKIHCFFALFTVFKIEGIEIGEFGTLGLQPRSHDSLHSQGKHQQVTAQRRAGPVGSAVPHLGCTTLYGLQQQAMAYLVQTGAPGLSECLLQGCLGGI